MNARIIHVLWIEHHGTAVDWDLFVFYQRHVHQLSTTLVYAPVGKLLKSVVADVVGARVHAAVEIGRVVLKI